MDEVTKRRLMRVAEAEGLDRAGALRLVRHVIQFIPAEEQEDYIREAVRSTSNQSPIVRGHDGRYGTTEGGVEPPDIQPCGE